MGSFIFEFCASDILWASAGGYYLLKIAYFWVKLAIFSPYFSKNSKNIQTWCFFNAICDTKVRYWIAVKQVSGVFENHDIFVNFDHSNVDVAINAVKLAILVAKMVLSENFKRVVSLIWYELSSHFWLSSCILCVLQTLFGVFEYFLILGHFGQLGVEIWPFSEI